MDLIKLTSNVFDAEATDDLHASVARTVEREMLEVLAQSPTVDDVPLVETPGYGALQSLSDAERRRFYLSPPARYWVRAMRRATGLGATEWIERFASEFGSLAWMYDPVSTERHPIRLDSSGGLRIAENGRYVEFGPRYTDEVIEISGTGNGFSALLSDGTTAAIPLDDVWETPESPLPTIEENGYALYMPETGSGFDLPISPRDPWLRSQLTGTNQRSNGMQFFPEDRPFEEVTKTKLSTLTEVYELLKVVWPDHIDEIRAYVGRIVPLKPEESCHKAYTVSSRQGVIYMAPAPTLAIAEMLVHEVAHIKMRDIQVVDMLMNDFASETVRIKVPWREDPRPIPGILEGLFVFTHVAEMEKRILLVAEDAHLEERFSQRLEALEFADSAVRQHADLTEAGKLFVDIIAQWRADLRGVHVSA